MLERNPYAVQAAKRLADERPIRSLRDIADALAGQGYVAKDSGRPSSCRKCSRSPGRRSFVVFLFMTRGNSLEPCS
jgi:hypothetical protein